MHERERFKRKLLTAYDNPDNKYYTRHKISYINDKNYNKFNQGDKKDTLLLITKIELTINKPFYQLDTLEELISYLDFNFMHSVATKLKYILIMNDFILFLRNKANLRLKDINKEVFDYTLEGTYENMITSVYKDRILFDDVLGLSIKRRQRKVRTLFDYLLMLIFENKVYDPEAVVLGSLVFLGVQPENIKYTRTRVGAYTDTVSLLLYHFAKSKLERVNYNTRTKLEKLVFDYVVDLFGMYEIGRALMVNYFESRANCTNKATLTRNSFIRNLTKFYNIDSDNINDKMYIFTLTNMKHSSVFNRMDASILDEDLLKVFIDTEFKDDRELWNKCKELKREFIRKEPILIYIDAFDLYHYYNFMNDKVYNNAPKIVF